MKHIIAIISQKLIIKCHKKNSHIAIAICIYFITDYDNVCISSDVFTPNKSFKISQMLSKSTLDSSSSDFTALNSVVSFWMSSVRCLICLCNSSISDVVTVEIK